MEVNGWEGGGEEEGLLDQERGGALVRREHKGVIVLVTHTTRPA